MIYGPDWHQTLGSIWAALQSTVNTQSNIYLGHASAQLCRPSDVTMS